MNYASIVLQTQTLLAELAEGSGTYSEKAYSDGVQWAQEQAVRLLGLTYTEAVIGTTGATAASGETEQAVLIPVDAIKVTRLQAWDAGMTGLIGG